MKHKYTVVFIHAEVNYGASICVDWAEARTAKEATAKALRKRGLRRGVKGERSEDLIDVVVLPGHLSVDEG